MTNKKKKKILSYKKVRESFSGSSKYPGFQARMMASLIDLTLIALLFSPLFMLLGNLVYGDSAPSEMIRHAVFDMIEVNKDTGMKPDFIAFISTNPEYSDYFFKQYGLIKMVLLQLSQLIAIMVVVMVFWFKKQATPGKMLLSMKIVDAKTLGKPSSRQLIIRLVGYIISVVPVFLGVIWIVFDSRKQAWHDKIANTLVIKV
ncbi:MAG: RDD family protein [Rickettsiales bacterium]|jgi:uncharacterized RDD family membrane protein YckC|nr:RDD family protein [Rickettsiales bacterium]